MMFYSNNMPCIALSEDFIYSAKAQAGSPLVVNPKDVYYRPFYNLPGFNLICNAWQYTQTDPATATRFGPIPISLLDAIDNRSWSDLGHPGLDKAKALKLSDAERELLKTLRVTLTFIGEPATIDVNRGFWDVPNVRTALPRVAETLPPVVSRPFCKTIKMMLAWAIEISVKLPISSSELSNNDVSLGFLNIPWNRTEKSTNELLFTTDCSTYPLLLATLAVVV